MLNVRYHVREILQQTNLIYENIKKIIWFYLGYVLTVSVKEDLQKKHGF